MPIGVLSDVGTALIKLGYKVKGHSIGVISLGTGFGVYRVLYDGKELGLWDEQRKLFVE